MEPPRWKVGRRRFMKLGVVGGALLGTGSIVAFFRTRGYEVPAARAAKLEALSPWQLVVLEHAARRIAQADAPDMPSADDVDVASFVDGYIAKMASPLRRDLLRFFGYVEHVAPIESGLVHRFTLLSAADQDRVLAKLEAHPNTLLRGGFQGLKALVFMGYYRDARTWRALSYDGPRVGRPEKGWW